jgi:hypothetical protein
VITESHFGRKLRIGRRVEDGTSGGGVERRRDEMPCAVANRFGGSQRLIVDA